MVISSQARKYGAVQEKHAFPKEIEIQMLFDYAREVALVTEVDQRYGTRVWHEEGVVLAHITRTPHTKLNTTDLDVFGLVR
ncbi:exported protein [Moniliophthora roreri]|nr:exported protein [Moniliophthora roreri]